MEECKLSISSKARVPPLRTPIGKDQFLFKILSKITIRCQENCIKTLKLKIKIQKWIRIQKVYLNPKNESESIQKMD